MYAKVLKAHVHAVGSVELVPESDEPQVRFRYRVFHLPGNGRERQVSGQCSIYRHPSLFTTPSVAPQNHFVLKPNDILFRELA
jgi:hypothetical protein